MLTRHYPSVVRGWRYFALQDDALRSPFAEYFTAGRSGADVWQPGLNVARCWLRRRHVAPAAYCLCGFRATEKFSELTHMADLAPRVMAAGGYGPSIRTRFAVLARVEMGGRIRPGSRFDPLDTRSTWRASHARLLELYMPPEHAAVSDALSDRYDVPVSVHAVGVA